ncbi:MAG: flagellin, partial [Chloroflexi bacterium]|nr:flagellin [Chloroflexota bacterium]
MGLRINTNVEAIDAQRNLQLTSMDFQKSIERLSSGLRINSAADDPAGLAVSQTLTSQVNGFDQAQRNIQDGISMTQVADGALNSTESALQRMRTLAVQAATDSLTNTDRANIQSEVNQLVQEIDRISSQTEFNTKKLLDGSAGSAQAVGGGPDIKQIVAEGQVAVAGSWSLTQNGGGKGVNATKSALESGAFSTGTFTQASNVTITGAGGTQTFTAAAGESVQDFFKQVNTSTVGVTMQVDQTSGLVQLVNNDYGLAGKDANGNTNATGAAAVSIANVTGDFALGGAIDLTGVGGATTGSVDNTGKY